MQQVKEEDNGLKPKAAISLWSRAIKYTYVSICPYISMSLSMGSSRQECWSGLPFPSSGDLPNPGIKPGSPALQADSLPSEPPGSPRTSEVWPTQSSLWNWQDVISIPLLYLILKQREDSVFSTQGTRVRSLVRELDPPKSLHAATKKIKAGWKEKKK